MTETPTFEPRNGSPTVHVNVRTIRSKEDHQQAELQRMWKEHANETTLAQQKEEEQPQQKEEELHGATVYDLAPVTTYEYDVVACADFVQDKGCWVRNMPQEIKDANPNFVPS
jgi:glutathione synthase/RimK-type ligase-like ATP-grasp enzyme